jgi:hypothetical protein
MTVFPVNRGRVFFKNVTVPWGVIWPFIRAEFSGFELSFALLKLKVKWVLFCFFLNVRVLSFALK